MSMEYIVNKEARPLFEKIYSDFHETKPELLKV